MATDRNLAGHPPTVAASMAAHASALKAKQTATRAASKAALAQASRTDAPIATRTKPTSTGNSANKEPKPDARIAALVAWRSTATGPTEVLDIVDAAIRRGTSTPRATAAKAEPAVVAAFFASTGLTRKQIADAVGVSTSVIGTVQKETGDRWSLARFEAAKPLIQAAAGRAPTTKVAND